VSASNYGRVTATRNLSHLGARAIKPGPSTTSPVRLQLGVLLCCQAQEYPASANLDRLVQRLPAFQVRQPAAPLNQLDDLVRRREVQLPRQRSLQIFLEELAMPARAALERHVNPAAIILTRHGGKIGE
jgi:hypothetical protein